MIRGHHPAHLVEVPAVDVTQVVPQPGHHGEGAAAHGADGAALVQVSVLLKRQRRSVDGAAEVAGEARLSGPPAAARYGCGRRQAQRHRYQAGRVW